MHIYRLNFKYGQWVVGWPVILGLSGCGFEPLYRSASDAPRPTGAQSIITSSPSINVYGEGYMVQHFRQLLETRCRLIQGLQNCRIDIRLTEKKVEIGYSKQGTPLRTQLTFVANYKLYAMPSEKIISQNDIYNSTSYQVNPDEEFINLSSYRGAQDRAIITLAEDVFCELVQAMKVVGK